MKLGSLKKEILGIEQVKILCFVFSKSDSKQVNDRGWDKPIPQKQQKVQVRVYELNTLCFHDSVDCEYVEMIEAKLMLSSEVEVFPFKSMMKYLYIWHISE